MQENNQDNFNGEIDGEVGNQIAEEQVLPENPPPQESPPPLSETPVTPCYVPVYIPVNLQTPQDGERRKIRKNALIVGLCGIGMIVISAVWGVVYYAVMGMLGYAPSEAYKTATDPFFLQAVQIAVSILMFVVLFSLIFKIGGYKISELVKLGKPKKETVLP